VTLKSDKTSFIGTHCINIGLTESRDGMSHQRTAAAVEKL